MTEPLQIELKVFKDPNAFQRDFWVKIPISEQMLEYFWGKRNQPSFEDLVDRIGNCLRDWLLEETSDRGNPNPTDFSLPEFFD